MNYKASSVDKTKHDLELLDTPGVLWPKFEDEKIGLNLAFTVRLKMKLWILKICVSN